MRNKQFVAEHRGGLLTKDHHKELIIWACKCAENVLPLSTNKIDKRLIDAIKTAKDWTNDNATVGDCRNAAFDAIAVANEGTNPAEVAVARSVGHAVATAHMADHSLRASEYALKAAKLAGKSTDIEREFQDQLLSPSIAELVLSSRKNVKL